MKSSKALEMFDIGMSEKRLMRNTRTSYIGHVRGFLRFKQPDSSADVEEKVKNYLSWLALNRSAATQKQALNAIVHFYRILERPLGDIPAWLRPTMKKRIPTYVTIDEARAIIDSLPAPWNEMTAIMIGSGLRIGEVLNLRIKDIDLESHTVTVRRGKGDKDRVTVLAKSLSGVLKARIEHSQRVWKLDRKNGANGVYLPDGLERKFPNAGKELAWFWLWPAKSESVDPDSGIRRRHCMMAQSYGKALKKGVVLSGVTKRVTAHAFRHGFATAYLKSGGAIHELKELMGHKDIATTEIYLHCLPQISRHAKSPLDNGNIIDFRKHA